eukprot:Tamp_10034.p2 GENE.Tamp_10034~~Tamp_10034.p2  ORF type:complete len:123 (-),score=15.14 Tamp_10034:740-1108(-)
MAGVPEGTVLLTNLPYGKRLQHVQAARRKLERLMHQRPDLRVYAIAPRGVLARRPRHASKETGTPACGVETNELGKSGTWSNQGLSSHQGHSSNQGGGRSPRWKEVIGFENRGIPVALCKGL